MEWLGALLIVFVVVLLVGGLFAAAGVRGPWSSLLWFFVFFFVATWAIGAWAQPVGPQAWGVNWLGFLVVAILVGLLIAAATPDYGYRRIEDRRLTREPGVVPPDAETTDAELGSQTPDTTSAAATAVGAFFWIFILFALAVLLLSFFFQPIVAV